MVVEDPWSTAYGGSAAAPFDQGQCFFSRIRFDGDGDIGVEFYLVIDLAVGGTSGWFPDSVGGKLWYDGSSSRFFCFLLLGGADLRCSCDA